MIGMRGARRHLGSINPTTCRPAGVLQSSLSALTGGRPPERTVNASAHLTSNTEVEVRHPVEGNTVTLNLRELRRGA